MATRYNDGMSPKERAEATQFIDSLNVPQGVSIVRLLSSIPLSTPEEREAWVRKRIFKDK